MQRAAKGCGFGRTIPVAPGGLGRYNRIGGENMGKKQETTEYVRQFSRLEGLQAAYSLRYRLRREADRWRLELTRSDGAQTAMGLRCSGAQARQLLRLLYENAVQPEHGAALAQDLCPEWLA